MSSISLGTTHHHGWWGRYTRVESIALARILGVKFERVGPVWAATALGFTLSGVRLSLHIGRAKVDTSR